MHYFATIIHIFAFVSFASFAGDGDGGGDSKPLATMQASIGEEGQVDMSYKYNVIPTAPLRGSFRLVTKPTLTSAKANDTATARSLSHSSSASLEHNKTPTTNDNAYVSVAGVAFRFNAPTDAPSTNGKDAAASRAMSSVDYNSTVAKTSDLIWKDDAYNTFREYGRSTILSLQTVAACLLEFTNWMTLPGFFYSSKSTTAVPVEPENERVNGTLSFLSEDACATLNRWQQLVISSVSHVFRVLLRVAHALYEYDNLLEPSGVEANSLEGSNAGVSDDRLTKDYKLIIDKSDTFTKRCIRQAARLLDASGVETSPVALCSGLSFLDIVMCCWAIDHCRASKRGAQHALESIAQNNKIGQLQQQISFHVIVGGCWAIDHSRVSKRYTQHAFKCIAIKEEIGQLKLQNKRQAAKNSQLTWQNQQLVERGAQQETHRDTEIGPQPAKLIAAHEAELVELNLRLKQRDNALAESENKQNRLTEQNVDLTQQNVDLSQLNSDLNKQLGMELLNNNNEIARLKQKHLAALHPEQHMVTLQEAEQEFLSDEVAALRNNISVLAGHSLSLFSEIIEHDGEIGQHFWGFEHLVEQAAKKDCANNLLKQRLNMFTRRLKKSQERAVQHAVEVEELKRDLDFCFDELADETYGHRKMLSTIVEWILRRCQDHVHRLTDLDNELVSLQNKLNKRMSLTPVKQANVQRQEKNHEDGGSIGRVGAVEANLANGVRV
ncbi:hypothetical protein MPSEU_000228400 [Mayamaea pseudoterrestris]|nr:hypothetical protein MPSEU_000228400 [Mayamaea pseudoterrestris]